MCCRKDERSGCRARREVRKLGRREDIWEASEAETTEGGTWRSWEDGSEGKRARLRTAHHMGVVLERASGMRLPRRVESTMMHLWSYPYCQ